MPVLNYTEIQRKYRMFKNRPIRTRIVIETIFIVVAVIIIVVFVEGLVFLGDVHSVFMSAPGSFSYAAVDSIDFAFHRNKYGVECEEYKPVRGRITLVLSDRFSINEKNHFIENVLVKEYNFTILAKLEEIHYQSRKLPQVRGEIGELEWVTVPFEISVIPGSEKKWAERLQKHLEIEDVRYEIQSCMSSLSY